jgi:thioredoxin-related protein
MIKRATWILCTSLFLGLPAACAEDPVSPEGAGVEWFKFDEAVKQANTDGKHIMVDVYTDWCGWCKKLDAETYSNPEVRKVLDASYVSSKVKGDSGGPLKVKGQPLVEGERTFLQFVATEDVMTTEKELTRSSFQITGYPTIVFLGADGRMITKIPGFQNAEQFKNLLNFIKDDLYQVMSYQDYLKSLDGAQAAGKDKS